MHIGLVVQNVIPDIINRKEKPIITTTLSALDKALWGLHHGELLVVGGRPGEGKSSLLIQMAYIISSIKNVVFISLEMSNEQITERIICNEYSLDSEKMRSGDIIENIVLKKEDIENDFKLKKLFLLDNIGRTPKELEETIEQLNPIPDIIFIDHLQQISVRNANRLESLDEYVRFLKAFAFKHNIAIVLASQLHRGAEETDRPYLWQLKSCGSIEEVADTVILIWNKTNGETMLLIEKQRHGPTGNLVVDFEKNYFRFKDKKKEDNDDNKEIKQKADLFGRKDLE